MMTFPIWKGMEGKGAALRRIDPALSPANVKVGSPGGFPGVYHLRVVVVESVWKR